MWNVFLANTTKDLPVFLVPDSMRCGELAKPTRTDVLASHILSFLVCGLTEVAPVRPGANSIKSSASRFVLKSPQSVELGPRQESQLSL